MTTAATPRAGHPSRCDDAELVIDLRDGRPVSRDELIARLPAGSRYAHADLHPF